MSESAPTRVVVVEDEAIIAMDLERRLSELGYQVVGSAANADKAIETVGLVEPDIVLMDIQLSGERDGVYASGQIKELYGTPVVFLTAYSDSEIVERAIQTDPMGYLLKPFSDREVRATIELAIAKRKFETELDHQRQLLEEKVVELNEALAHVKELRALIPICAWCKDIRNEDGYWVEVSNYITKNTNSKFTHGLCDACANKLAEEDND